MIGEDKMSVKERVLVGALLDKELVDKMTKRHIKASALIRTLLEEYAKCILDPIYGIETYLETKDNTQGGFVPFKLFPRQKEIVQGYEDHRFNLVTKPRQAGISTTTQAYMSIKVGFANPDNPEVILIIANKLTLAKKFLRGIKDYLKQRL